MIDCRGVWLLACMILPVTALTSGLECCGQVPSGTLPTSQAERQGGRHEIPEQIVVATREVPPFSLQNADGKWTGLSIDLLREIIADLETESGHEIQVRFESMSLEEMLDEVSEGRVDLAAAAITINHDREKRMDFSHAYFGSGLGIAVGPRQRRSGWTGMFEAIVSPTFARVLLGLIAAMLLSATAVHFFERKHLESDFDGGWVKGIGAGLWWAAVTLTTVGYGDKAPKTLPGRMIASIWMFSGLFIIASFTAAVSSALTVNQLRSRINGPGDLLRVKVATVTGATSAAYLDARNIRFESFPDVDTALQRLQDGRCDAVVYDAPILRYTVLQRTNADLFVLPITFERQNYAFALPSNSTLLEAINRSLLRQTSLTMWEETLERYLGVEDQVQGP